MTAGADTPATPSEADKEALSGLPEVSDDELADVLDEAEEHAETDGEER